MFPGCVVMAGTGDPRVCRVVDAFLVPWARLKIEQVKGDRLVEAGIWVPQEGPVDGSFSLDKQGKGRLEEHL